MCIMRDEFKKKISELEDWDTVSEEKRDTFMSGFYHGFISCLFYYDDSISEEEKEQVWNEALSYVRYCNVVDVDLEEFQ